MNFVMCAMSLAARLQAARKQKKLSQEALGELVGLTQQTINAIEEGKTRHPRKIKQLAQALDTTPQFLLYAITDDGDPFANLDRSTYALMMDAAKKLASPRIDPDVRGNAISALRMVAKQDVGEYNAPKKKFL